MTLSAFFLVPVSLPSTNPILFTFCRFHCFLLPTKALLFHPILPSHLHKHPGKTDVFHIIWHLQDLAFYTGLSSLLIPSPSSNITFVFEKVIQDDHPNNSPICFFPQVPQKTRTYILPYIKREVLMLQPPTGSYSTEKGLKPLPGCLHPDKEERRSSPSLDFGMKSFPFSDQPIFDPPVA